VFLNVVIVVISWQFFAGSTGATGPAGPPNPFTDMAKSKMSSVIMTILQTATFAPILQFVFQSFHKATR